MAILSAAHGVEVGEQREVDHREWDVPAQRTDTEPQNVDIAAGCY